jgi:hypothetical protein
VTSVARALNAAAPIKMTDRRGSGEVEGFGQPDRRQFLHRAKIKIRDANMDQYASPPDLLSLVALMLTG